MVLVAAAQISSVLLVALTYMSTTVSAENKCDTCRGIATKFKEVEERFGIFICLNI